MKGKMDGCAICLDNHNFSIVRHRHTNTCMQQALGHTAKHTHEGTQIHTHLRQFCKSILILVIAKSCLMRDARL